MYGEYYVLCLPNFYNLSKLVTGTFTTGRFGAGCLWRVILRATVLVLLQGVQCMEAKVDYTRVKTV